MKAKIRSKPKYNPEYIARVIKERNFHDLPDWLVKMVDTKVFERLLESMGEIISDEYKKPGSEVVGQEYIDCLDFISQCITNGISILRIFNHIARKYDQTSVVATVVPYMVTLDNEWWAANLILLSKWLPNMSHDDAIAFLFEYRQAFYIWAHEVSVSLTDMISKVNNDYIEATAGSTNISSYNRINKERRAGIRCLMIKMVGDDVRKFYEQGISIGATLANTKYPLLKPMYAFGNIWDSIPQFYPANVKDYMMVASYLYMIASTEEPVNMSDNIYPILERMMFEHRASHDDIVVDIIELIAKATKKDVNNVRFLIPFKEIASSYADTDDFVAMRLIATALKDTVRAVCDDKKQKLIDFKYLYDNYSSQTILSNQNLQRSFILNGGRAYTLTKSYLNTDVNTIIYEPDGLDLAIRYSHFEDLSILLEDEEIVRIIYEDLVGKVPYYTTMSYIVYTILRMSSIPENLVSLLTKIGLAYPAIPGSDDAIRIRISNINPIEARQFDYSIIASNVPVTNQSYQKLVSHIITCKKYIPLYYGINKKPDIDKLLPVSLIDEIVDISPGYIGDISSEVIGKSMLLKHGS